MLFVGGESFGDVLLYLLVGFWWFLVGLGWFLVVPPGEFLRKSAFSKDSNTVFFLKFEGSLCGF